MSEKGKQYLDATVGLTQYSTLILASINWAILILVDKWKRSKIVLLHHTFLLIIIPSHSVSSGV
jgi:hypothetical protein